MKEKVYMNKRTGELYRYFYCKENKDFYWQTNNYTFFGKIYINTDDLEYLGEL